MNNNNTINNDQLSIIELTSNINTIGCEKNKNEFIKNYSYYKETINYIDKRLSENEEFEQYYLDKNIDELFIILEKYQDKISNPENINVIDFKLISLLVKIIENKIENEKLTVTEIK
jgi:hypothetical protein